MTILASCLAFALTQGSDAENIVYPQDAEAVLDVTQPPYRADNTGTKDCTAILIRAIDDILRPDREALQRTIRNIRGERKDVFRADQTDFAQRQRVRRENPEAVIGFERCSGTFPYRNPPSRILYFPNGIYLVSDTICYTLPHLQNASGMEFNRCLHFRGQSERGTIIHLRGNAAGFQRGSHKPVISFMRGTRSNVAMQNSCENLTIEIGSGNPGAVGLHFFANNTGAVRHVTVRSCDRGHAGRAGIAMTTFNSSCVLLQHLTVDGCDYGIEIDQHRLYTVLEHITLRNQRLAGFYLKDHNVAARRLVSYNAVPAVRMEGTQATLALLDSEFSGVGPGAAAVDFRAGFLYARNVGTTGYRVALDRAGSKAIEGSRIEEFVSHSCPTLFDGQCRSSLRLDVEETPDVPWEQDMSQWISVNACGASGDGLDDDTEAIQAAMNAGRPVVYFQPGAYLINETITIPPHVDRVNFMYADLVSGGDLQAQEGQGALKVVGEAARPLIVEDLFAFELNFGSHYLIDHASRRTLVLSDLHTQVGAMYTNSISGGKVFIENVCTTDPFPPFRNCFSFTGQRVWARQLNPERANPEVLNRGSSVWVLGFKTEKSGTAFHTAEGGYTEVLGGIFNISRAADSAPMIVNEDSYVSIFASTTDHRERPAEFNQRPFIAETRGGVTRVLAWDQFPKRDEQLIVVPLYAGGPPQ
jgi:hypothetical protein